MKAKDITFTLAFDPRGILIPADKSQRHWNWDAEPDFSKLEEAYERIRNIRKLSTRMFPCIRCSTALKSDFARWFRRNNFYSRTGIGYGETVFATEGGKQFVAECRQNGVTHFIGSIEEDLAALVGITTYYFVSDENKPSGLIHTNEVRTLEEIEHRLQEFLCTPFEKGWEPKLILPPKPLVQGEFSADKPLENFRNLLQHHSWAACELYHLCLNESHVLVGNSFEILKRYGLLKVWRPSEKIEEMVIDEVERRMDIKVNYPYTWVAKNPSGKKVRA